MLKGKELGTAIRKALADNGKRPSDAAAYFNVKAPSVNGWLKTGRISKENFNRLVRWLDKTPVEFWGSDAFIGSMSTDQGQSTVASGVVTINLDNNPDYPAIRRVRIKAQAGISGYAVEYMNDDGPPIVFRKDWYAANGYQPEKMLALRITGDSMNPNYYPGDLIIINTLQTEPKDGRPFVVSYEGEIIVKRLVRDDGQWWITSDNPDQRRYPRKKCNGDTEIIGQVVYRQTEHV